MPRFEIEVSRAWRQIGVVVVEADSLVDAKDRAVEIARDDDHEVEWDDVDLDMNRDPRAEWGREVQ